MSPLRGGEREGHGSKGRAQDTVKKKEGENRARRKKEPGDQPIRHPYFHRDHDKYDRTHEHLQCGKLILCLIRVGTQTGSKSQKRKNMTENLVY